MSGREGFGASTWRYRSAALGIVKSPVGAVGRERAMLA
jgi:hypothetical protein